MLLILIMLLAVLQSNRATRWDEGTGVAEPHTIGFIVKIKGILFVVYLHCCMYFMYDKFKLHI